MAACTTPKIKKIFMTEITKNVKNIQQNHDPVNRRYKFISREAANKFQ